MNLSENVVLLSVSDRQTVSLHCGVRAPCVNPTVTSRVIQRMISSVCAICTDRTVDYKIMEISNLDLLRRRKSAIHLHSDKVLNFHHVLVIIIIIIYNYLCPFFTLLAAMRKCCTLLSCAIKKRLYFNTSRPSVPHPV